MAAITVANSGVNNIDSIVGRQGNDTFSIAGTSTTTLLVDQDTAYGQNCTPLSRALNTITASSTLGGSLALEGRYVRLIPYNSGTGSVPPPGVTITQGSASGILIGVYSALNVAPESVGAAMPSSGYIKIKGWNDVPYTSGALTIPSTSGQQLVTANVSSFEGLLAASDMTITAGTGALTNSSTFAQTGSKSLRIAPSSTTTIVTKMANGTRFMIGAGAQATVSAYIRGSDVKSCTVDIEWFDSTNASISTTTIQTQNCSSSAFTQYTAAAVTAPANTKWASVNITVTSPTNGGFYYVDNITVTLSSYSTSATSTGADRVGWIEVVSREGVNHILTAAGQGYYSDYSFCKGSWYEIGTTDGNRATTYQIPTNGNASYHGGVLVDKAAAVNISSASWSAGVATFNTSSAHGLTTGDRVFIDEVSPRLYTSNMNNIEACTVIDSDTFSIPMTSNPGTYVSGGSVAAVEWFPTTTDLNTTIRTERVPGSVCWLNSSNGLLSFGNDGTTSTGGYCPATGLKIRLPNVMTAAVDSGHTAPLTNALAATTTSRCRFYAGTTAGRIVASQMSGTWNTTVVQTGKYARFNDCVWVGNVVVASQGEASSIIFNCLGSNGSSTFSAGITLSAMLSGTTVLDNVICVGSMASTKQGISFSTASNLTVNNNKIIGTGNRLSSNSYGFNFSIGGTATFDNNTIVNCGGWFITSQFINATMTNTHYWGSGAGYVPVANPMSMCSWTNVSTGWDLDALYVDQPGPFNIMRNAVFSTSGTSDSIEIKNVGSYASPIDAATSLYYGKSFSRVTTTATIAHTAHGLRNNDVIWVMASTDTSTSPVSSARAAIVVGSKTITVVDADTFTFTCLNAGPTVGTIDYYGCGLVSSVSNIGSRNVTMQNVHIIGCSTAGIVGSNASDNIKHENCTFEYRNNGTTSSLNRANNTQTLRSGYIQSYEYAQAASSTLGVHFSDYFVRPTTTPGTDTVVSGVSWTRSGTLVTVVKSDHGLHDNERIYVENSSNQATIPNGVKELSVLVINKDTFSITGVNTGATSGTLDYRLPGDGYVLITPDDTSSYTTGQVIVSGTAAITGAGTLYAPAVNDQVEWIQPDYMIGWDHFAKFPGTVYGSGVVASQYDLYYQVDTGSGFSAYKNLAYNRGGASGSSGATTFTVTNSTGVNVGDYVYGIGIAGGAKVTNNNTGTNTITVDTAHTATVSGNIIFNYAPNEATFPSTGVKLKVKLVTNTTNTGSLYGIWVGMVSTETTRAELYPQTATVPISIRALDSSTLLPIENARVYLKAALGGPESTGTMLLTGLTDASGYLTGTYGWSADQPVVGWVRKASAAPFYAEAPLGGTITASGFTTNGFLVEDQ